MDRLAGGKFQRSGRGGGRAQRAHRRGGAFGPRPCGGFAGPSGPQNAAAPPRTPPRQPSSPRASAPPPALRRLPGSAGRMGRTCGGRRRLAAGGRPQGRPPACQTKERGPGPRAPGPALSGRFASCRRPPPPGFPPTPKRQRKARPHALWAGHINDGRKVHGNIPVPLGKAAAHTLRAAAA